MSTTRADISGWFDDGVRNGMTHLLVMTDTFDWEDYPVYAASDEAALQNFRNRHNGNMQRVTEIYDLRLDKETQLNEHRAWHLPKESA